MIPKFRAYLKIQKKIVDVREIDYRCNCIIWMNEKHTEIEGFEDIELIQSTGLKDKNGVEIFEGDIVNVHEFINVGGIESYEEGERETIGVIKYGCLYDSPIPEWYLQTKDDCVSFIYMGLHEESFEVIGNKFEHKELLEYDSE